MNPHSLFSLQEINKKMIGLRHGHVHKTQFWPESNSIQNTMIRLEYYMYSIDIPRSELISACLFSTYFDSFQFILILLNQ